MLVNVWFTKRRKFSASSFYPNRGDFAHPLTALDPENQLPHDLEPNDNNIEHEDDWLEPKALVDVARKTSTKTLEATATEVSLQHLSVL